MAFDISKKTTADSGQWTTLDGFGDAEFKIVRAGDRSVRAGRQEIITKDYGRKHGKGKMSEMDMIDLGLKVSAKYILVDWRNIVDGSGQEIEYSPKQAFDFFETVVDMLEAVNEYSLDDANFLEAEEVAKKSGKTSNSSKG